jgi:hypothetical protein
MTTKTSPQTKGLIRQLVLEVQTRDPQRRPPTHDDVIRLALETQLAAMRRGGGR